MRLSLLPLVSLLALVPLSGTAATPDDTKTGAEGDMAVAVFAGGCFWCMEPPFDKLDGVKSTTSGYTGGDVADPTYQQVTAGGTGHYEAERIVYDPDKISYERLLEVFWRNIDPLDDGGQFCDRGNSYRTGIFYQNTEQKRLAEASKKELAQGDQLDGTIVTPIEKAMEFYPAEDYHQNYYKKNPIRYKTYRYLCGRDDRLEAVWGDQAGGHNQQASR